MKSYVSPRLLVPPAIGALIAGAVLSGAALAAVKPAAPHDSYRDNLTTPAAAVASVRALAGLEQKDVHSVSRLVQAAPLENMTADGPHRGKLNDYYRVTGPHSYGIVDVHDGHVAQLVLPDLVPSVPVTSTISGDEAISRANGYLEHAGIATTGLSQSATLVDMGGGVFRYDVVWCKTINGVLVPDSRSVSLDAGSGLVFEMHDTHRPFAVPESPKVGRDAAIVSARALIASLRAEDPLFRNAAAVDSVSATVNFDESGVQSTVWVIGLSPHRAGAPNEHFLVSVDASTGSATLTGQS